MKESSQLTLRVLTPEGIVTEVEGLRSIIVPISDGGTIGIHTGHAPLIAETTKGNVVYSTEFEENKVSLNPGVLSVNHNKVVILTSGEAKLELRSNKLVSDLDHSRLLQTLAGNLTVEVWSDTKNDNDE